MTGEDVGQCLCLLSAWEGDCMVLDFLPAHPEQEGVRESTLRSSSADWQTAASSSRCLTLVKSASRRSPVPGWMWSSACS